MRASIENRIRRLEARRTPASGLPWPTMDPETWNRAAAHYYSEVVPPIQERFEADPLRLVELGPESWEQSR
jgi:hypothetical protein